MPGNREKYKNFNQIVNTFYNEEVAKIDTQDDKTNETGNINIETKIFYDKFLGDMKLEFKIGNKKMYKIKNLSEFYTRIMQKEFYRYGEKLKFIHTEDAFSDESRNMQKL